MVGELATGTQAYAAGFAVAFYDISTCEHLFRFGREVYTVPYMSVRTEQWRGLPVASIDDVRRAAERMERVH